MKCKSCDGKMIKVSDLAFEEIENFFNNNPLKSLDRLENGDGVLVYYREILLMKMSFMVIKFNLGK